MIILEQAARLTIAISLMEIALRLPKGYPFVFLAILMLERPAGEAIAQWLTRVILWEVLGAVALGALTGYVAGKLLGWARKRGEIRDPSFLAYTIAVALAALGSTRLVGTDGILAVFAAGIALNMAVSPGVQEEDQIDESVNRFFVLPIFVLLGLALPWGDWAELGWKGPTLVVLLLLLRRLPWVLALVFLAPTMRGVRDGLFTGWFGPIGVAALYYATLAEHTGDSRRPGLLGAS